MDAGSAEVYCIAWGKGTSVNALYRGLVKEIGHAVEIRRALKRSGDIYLTYFVCGIASRELDWQAKLGLEARLRLTANYFRQNLHIA